jgi:hypothetical protein
MNLKSYNLVGLINRIKMIKDITMTDLLKKPKEVRKYVGRGFTLNVYLNDERVFDITPPKEEKKNCKKFTKTDLPKASLNLPENMTKREIYEFYGAPREVYEAKRKVLQKNNKKK